VIAREAGVIVTDAARGGRLRAPLDIRAPVAWAGYANAALRRGSSRTCARFWRR
jgi:hypothetical protein